MRRPEESDDEDVWEPIDENDDDDDDTLQQQQAPQPRTRQLSLWSSSSSTPRSNNSNHSYSSTTNRPRQRQSRSGTNPSLSSIQQRLETKVSLQSNLINHPIELFFKRFVMNIIREIWNLEWNIRLGLLFVICGLCIRGMIWSTWYLWYPRITITVILILASMIYLDPFHIMDQITFLQHIMIGGSENSPNEQRMMIQMLERWDLQHVRSITFGFFLVPTLLEMRTFSFLSQIKAENTGWDTYNVCIGVGLLSMMLYLYKIKHMSPRESIYLGLVMLYGSALFTTLLTFKTNLTRIPHLAGPFLTATGTLLITYKDQDMEWLSRLVRHTLRLTLRDVLSSVGERVAEDEMLQLAMLRWISDYWSYQANNDNDNDNSTFSSSSGPQHQPSSSTSSNVPSSTNMSLTIMNDRSNSESATTSQQSAIVPSHGGSTRTHRSTALSTAEFRTHDVQWNELLPMLQISTDHMQNEYETLHQQHVNGGDNHRTERNPYTTTTNNTSRSNSQQQQQQQQHYSRDTDAFESFKSMILSLNVDERAKPAVAAYKSAVQSFPPRQRTSVAIAIMRRRPALLALLTNLIVGSNLRSVFTSIVILGPFVTMEFFRIQQWIEACQKISRIVNVNIQQQQQSLSRSQNGHETKVDKMIPTNLRNIDPMIILLTGDSPYRPPSLLLVWFNIVSSVSALEVGLTAAKCVETTAVSLEFAGNVISLVKFGLEVSERGWVHGLSVIIQETLRMRLDDETTGGPDDMTRNRDNANVARAAVGAFHSGRRMSQSFHSLSEDENLGLVLQPFLRFIGFGWLFQGSTNPNDESLDTSAMTDHQNQSNDESVINGDNQHPQEINDVSVREERDRRALVAMEAMNSFHERSDQPPPPPPPKKAFHEELSEVMEMVAEAYELGLIVDGEKNDFLETLSRLSDGDRKTLKGLKRSMKIVLDNGSIAAQEVGNGSEEPPQETSHPSCAPKEDNTEVEPGTRIQPLPQTDQTETVRSQPPPLAHHLPPNFDEASNDIQEDEKPQGAPWLQMGVATIGVVAGGFLLSMKGRRGDDTNSSNGEGEGRRRNNGNVYSMEEDHYNDNDTRQSPTLQIEEIIEHVNSDDEWTAVSQ